MWRGEARSQHQPDEVLGQGEGEGEVAGGQHHLTQRGHQVSPQLGAAHGQLGPRQQVQPGAVRVTET